MSPRKQGQKQLQPGTGMLSVALHLISVFLFDLSSDHLHLSFIPITPKVTRRIFRVTGRFSDLERGWRESHIKIQISWGKTLLAQPASSVHLWNNYLWPGSKLYLKAFPGCPVVKTLPSSTGVWAQSLVWKLRFHLPCGQKMKTWSRSNIVTNSIKTFKMVKKKKKQPCTWTNMATLKSTLWIKRKTG